MVNEQLKSRGIIDERVLWAINKVKRHLFVAENERARAYEDFPIEIGYGATISQPYVVALSCQLLKLKGKEKVMEIGTGSGYQAAVLSLLSREVYSIEISNELANRALKRLRKMGYKNINVICKNGREGYRKESPYEAIVAAATNDKVPREWKKQLKNGGRLVMPLKSGLTETMIRITKKKEKYIQEFFEPVRFVRLI